MEKTIDPAHEIGENVTITERSQLLSITPEQAKKIKSLRIENQVIDSGIRAFLGSLGGLDSLCFYRCEFHCIYALNDVYGCSVLGLIDCSLTSDDATQLLSRISAWSLLKTLDLSHNMIGNDADIFFEWWKHEIWGVVLVEELILADNHFPKDSALLSDFKDECFARGSRCVF